MSVKLAQKDWILISAYLDGRLSSEHAAQVDARRSSDPTFDQACREMAYTRKLLKSLPSKRAPRNFTLSSEYALKKVKKWGVHSYFGLASATAAFALVAVFAWTNFFGFRAKAVPEALMAAPAAEFAMDEATGSADVNGGLPMIITWNNPGTAYGMGGGGGGGDSTVLAPKAVITQSESAMTEEAAPLTLSVTESPQVAENGTGGSDFSTLILGLPEPGSEGEVITREAVSSETTKPALPASTWWMIGLGAAALVSGALALILRRR